MNTHIHTFKDSSSKIRLFFKNELVFTVSVILALASSFFTVPKIEYIDFKVLACLFNLMIVVKAFEENKLLDRVAVSILNTCTDSRKVSLVMILLCFFSSMIITNDIALLTLVPLTLIISRKSKVDLMLTVILQTLAANIGSSLTPMGNPQNLYIVSYYQLTAAQFFVPLILFVGLGLLWLFILNKQSPKINTAVNLECIAIKDRNKSILWFVLFIIIILSVFGVINYILVLFLTVFLTLILNRRLLLCIDYLLLFTFICFFIFSGNISSIPAIIGLMEANINNPHSTYFGSIILSQIISNVPCAIFLSKFTTSWKELLLGVNIGGMGTIIASLASVISYKLYVKELPEESSRYMFKFSIYNFISLGLFTLINYFVVIR